MADTDVPSVWLKSAEFAYTGMSTSTFKNFCSFAYTLFTYIVFLTKTSTISKNLFLRFALSLKRIKLAEFRTKCIMVGYSRENMQLPIYLPTMIEYLLLMYYRIQKSSLNTEIINYEIGYKSSQFDSFDGNGGILTLDMLILLLLISMIHQLRDTFRHLDM